MIIYCIESFIHYIYVIHVFSAIFPNYMMVDDRKMIEKYIKIVSNNK